MDEPSNAELVLDLIRDQCGPEMADAVQRVFGGVRLIIPIPERLTKSSPLSRAFGLSVALKISEAVCCNGQGVTCIPPLGEESHPVKLSDEIRNRLRGGMPTRAVAKDLGIHERTVWRERAKLKRANGEAGIGDRLAPSWELRVNGLEKCEVCGKFALGSDVVTISMAEYQELKAASFELQARAAVRGVVGKTRSRIARDPELAAFIVALADSKLLKEITAECVVKFGRDRAPSRSAIHRFLVAIGER